MTEQRAPSPGVILAVVGFGVFVAADDLTVVTTMLRQMIGDLEIPLPDGLDDAAWIVNAYLVAYVAVMPFMGRISDVVGRRKVFVASLVVFVIGSVWVPLADSLGWFIAGRVLTAVGGGAMVPVALAVIGDVYESRRRPTAFGVLGAIETVGWVWGPMFGAFLVRYLSWRWQFYLNIPLGIAGMIAAWWALRGLDVAATRRRIDWTGAAALTLALVALNIALSNTSEISTVSGLEELTGATTGPIVPFFVVAAVSLAVFVWVELRTADPIVDVSLFARPNFGPAVVINFLVGAVLIIAMVDVPLFVNIVVERNLERAAVASGAVLSALTIAMAVMSYVGGRVTERTWYRPVVVAGLAGCGAGFLLMGVTWAADTSFGVMAWQLAILGAGFGLVTAPTNAAVVDAAPPDRRGTAAGLVIVARLLGLSVGLSGLTAWGVYRFNELRTRLDLPAVGDPGYDEALVQAQATTTASALAETFLFSVAVVGVAVMVALALRRYRPGSATTLHDEAGSHADVDTL